MRKIALGIILALFATTALAQDSVRVGYLHTLAVDGHLWTADMNDIFAQYDLDVEPVPFGSGPPLAQALSGGSVDVAIMGAVISNIPSRGVGTVFLVNNIEAGTAAIFVQGDSGIETVADLEGRDIATTQGTTAHVMLATALQDAGLDPYAAQIVNMDMPSATSAFISGAVPAVALWWPFDAQVREQRPEARVLATAGDYFPDAAIMGGWVANSNYYDDNREVLVRLASAWLDANEIIETDTENALLALQEIHYPDMEPEDLTSGFELLETFDNDGWYERYQDGTVEQWIGQVEQVFVDIGALETFVEPSEFFDSSIFLEAYEARQE